MFKIDFMVEDKHLPKAMHALNGLALNLSVVPVGNVVVKAGKVQQAEPGSSKAAIVAAKVAALSTGATVNGTQIKAFITEVGGEVNGYSYYVKAMTDAGVLKAIANRRGYYKVL